MIWIQDFLFNSKRYEQNEIFTRGVSYPQECVEKDTVVTEGISVSIQVGEVERVGYAGRVRGRGVEGEGRGSERRNVLE